MKNLKIPKAFNIVKRSGPRRFDYQPRIYNERKAEIERRKKIIQPDLGDQTAEIRARMESEIDNKWKRDNFKKQSGFANLRLMGILVVLLYVAYIIFTRIDQVSVLFE